MFRTIALWMLIVCHGSLAAAQTSVVEFYHVDALGSVRVVTNHLGQEIRRHDYRPFGEENGVPGSDQRRFAAKERDVETQLDYSVARYYNPRTARFSTVDPVLVEGAAMRDPQQWNRYSYARNNPGRYHDPDGRILWPVVAFAAAAGVLSTSDGSLREANDAMAAATAAALTDRIARGIASLGAKVLGRTTSVSRVANPVPNHVVRVIPGNRLPTNGLLGRDGARDVFVAAADDVAGLNAAQIAQKLHIPAAESFVVIRFPTPGGLASPIGRTNPGFLQGGLTRGGAREFVVPQQPIPPNATIIIVR